MLVLRYTDGDEELQEVDFIDLQEEESALAPNKITTFRMKGGHKVPRSSGELLQLILVAELGAPLLSIRVLKNRSYIT